MRRIGRRGRLAGGMGREDSGCALDCVACDKFSGARERVGVALGQVRRCDAVEHPVFKGFTRVFGTPNGL